MPPPTNWPAPVKVAHGGWTLAASPGAGPPFGVGATREARGQSPPKRRPYTPDLADGPSGSQLSHVKRKFPTPSTATFGFCEREGVYVFALNSPPRVAPRESKRRARMPSSACHVTTKLKFG